MTAEQVQVALRAALLTSGPEDVVVCWRTDPAVTAEGAPASVWRLEVIRAALPGVARRLPSHAWAYTRSGRACCAQRGRVGAG